MQNNKMHDTSGTAGKVSGLESVTTNLSNVCNIYLQSVCTKYDL
jgi:hypothetical protein